MVRLSGRKSNAQPPVVASGRQQAPIGLKATCHTAAGMGERGLTGSPVATSQTRTTVIAGRGNKKAISRHHDMVDGTYRDASDGQTVLPVCGSQIFTTTVVPRRHAVCPSGVMQTWLMAAACRTLPESRWPDSASTSNVLVHRQDSRCLPATDDCLG